MHRLRVADEAGKQPARDEASFARGETVHLASLALQRCELEWRHFEQPRLSVDREPEVLELLSGVPPALVLVAREAEEVERLGHALAALKGLGL